MYCKVGVSKNVLQRFQSVSLIVASWCGYYELYGICVKGSISTPGLSCCCCVFLASVCPAFWEKEREKKINKRGDSLFLIHCLVSQSKPAS